MDEVRQKESGDRVFVYENRTRFVYRIPVYRSVKRGDRTQLVVDHDKTVVIGDSADKVLPPGVTRNPRCPDPVVRLTQEQLKEIGPVGRQFLESLVSDEHLVFSQLAR